MVRIERQLPGQVRLAKRVLSWIYSAKRPLNTSELRHALATIESQVYFDKDNLSDIEDIVSVCAGLVTIDEESDIIRLVHYTAKKYFDQTQNDWFPTAEFDITATCVAYLSLRVFSSGFCHTDSSFEERLQLNPLYDYAARYWGYHAYQASELHPKVIDFMQCTRKLEAATQAMLARNSYPNSSYSQRPPRQITGLHLAAYFGITQSVEIILQSTDIESKDSRGQTPLSWAARNGHDGVVKQLLAAKADIESKDSEDRTPLSWAAANGHEGVVKQLLSAKADVESRYQQESYAAVPGRRKQA
jgi:hypothetical protein